ncbi:glycosyltransferase [Fictibacillus sp. b24]|uniref:glycosyltransferase n=1 Tax=Fictibacillus sp. b24 TaxID=3055863 RepID=UPI0025A08CEC|nr:glycosyltransferase [Fictibacillus sp. b24]MDM5314876.1 glycosyltransferase [Fictibacillus sp. b24]
MDLNSIEQRLQTLKKIQDSLNDDIALENKQIEKDKEVLRKIKKGISVNKLDLTPVIKETVVKKKITAKHSDTNEVLDGEERLEYLKYRDQHADRQFFKKVKGMLDQIPESNGSKYYPKSNVNIGIIADEFLFNSFDGTANFTYITRENYKQHGDKLDVFLIVSAWKGLNMEWKGLGNPKIRKHREDLFKIVDFYREKDIKIVFYSKEDPVNYDVFKELPTKCDYIFTTAAEKVDDYKKHCKNDKVEVLSFGVNPLYHNPVGMKKFQKRKEVLFAGSWYNKYPHRHVDTRILFDGVIESGLDLKIIDRNFDLKLAQYFFPKEYAKYTSPAVEHAYLQKLHKLYDWGINLNTVKDSSTMFANRVYELQALGNILISNYSKAVNDIFPNVFMVHDKNEVKEIINGFSDEEVYKHQIYGVRRVMSRETTHHRLEQLLKAIGTPFEQVKRKVAVVVKETNDKIQKMFDAQTYSDKELVLESSLNEEGKKQFDMIAFFDEDKEYGEFYLEDMINGFKYTNSDYITKEAYYNGDELQTGIEHDYVTTMQDKYRTVFWSESFSVDELKKLKGSVDLANGYSIDHFEFNNKRKTVKKETIDYKLSVIVPTYNNGEHLLNKCFNSLKRSSLFNDMEIIIVDDGSSDEITLKIINHIATENPNVKTYFYEKGGSGSASRPRNKGFELTTAPYVTYLDPDNEAINDGYYRMYEEIQGTDYDFIVGNMVRVADNNMHFNYFKTVIQYNNKQDVLEGNMKEYLAKTQFKAMSIQALILKRELIADHSLQMVEGAVGQDTLFFQELLLHSEKVKAIDLDIHVYYAAVSGSAVNSISKRFFEKYLILEKARYKAYKEYGILEDYLDKRFEYYFKNWYLEKLKKVQKDDVLESVRLLFEIFNIYKSKAVLAEPEIVRFSELVKNKDYETTIKEFVR